MRASQPHGCEARRFGIYAFPPLLEAALEDIGGEFAAPVRDVGLCCRQSVNILTHPELWMAPMVACGMKSE